MRRGVADAPLLFTDRSLLLKEPREHLAARLGENTGDHFGSTIEARVTEQ